jgi:primosomal protein N'
LQPINTNPIQTNALPANPLALQDIHVPEPITNYPIAYGWWILAALILLAIVLIIVKVKKTAKRNQVKKQALTQLKNTVDINNNELISLLKWAAMHYFSRVELAKLYGESLQHFLVNQLPEKYQIKFTELSDDAFKSQYQATFHNEVDTSFQQATLLWLNQAIPPKTVIQTRQAKQTKQKNTDTHNNVHSNHHQKNEGVST